MWRAGDPIWGHCTAVSIWQSEGKPASICSESVPTDDSWHWTASWHFLPDFSRCPQVLPEGTAGFLTARNLHVVFYLILVWYLCVLLVVIEQSKCSVQIVVPYLCVAVWMFKKLAVPTKNDTTRHNAYIWSLTAAAQSETVFRALYTNSLT